MNLSVRRDTNQLMKSFFLKIDLHTKETNETVPTKNDQNRKNCKYFEEEFVRTRQVLTPATQKL